MGNGGGRHSLLRPAARHVRRGGSSSGVVAVDSRLHSVPGCGGILCPGNPEGETGVMTLAATVETLNEERKDYLDSLHAIQWAYRDKVFPHDSHLFRPGEDRQHPPVFLKEHADSNVLVRPTRS